MELVHGACSGICEAAAERRVEVVNQVLGRSTVGGMSVSLLGILIKKQCMRIILLHALHCNIEKVF